MPNRVAVIEWRDVLVLSDDGRNVVSDYAELFEIAGELHTQFTQGWGMLVIIPPNAVPPPESVRNAINAHLSRPFSTLRAVSWCIEGAGFQSAMARAVLTGLRFLTSAPYSRNISTSLDESFTWMLPQLSGGERRLEDVDDAVRHVTAKRDALTRFHRSIRAAANGASDAE